MALNAGDDAEPRNSEAGEPVCSVVFTFGRGRLSIAERSAPLRKPAKLKPGGSTALLQAGRKLQGAPALTEERLSCSCNGIPACSLNAPQCRMLSFGSASLSVLAQIAVVSIRYCLPRWYV